MPLSSVKLKTKLQLSFVLIGIVSISITGWQAYRSARSSLEEATFQRLTALRQSRRRQVESYFADIRNKVLTIASDAGTLSLFHRMQGEPPPLRMGEADAFFTSRIRSGGYDDLMLADAASGKILYTYRRNIPHGSSLRSEALRNTNMARAFHLAARNNGSTHPRFVDFELHSPGTEGPVAYAAAPIRENGLLTAVLLLRIAIEDINALMTDHGRWEHDILGESGETYIVGEDRKMRNDSRFFIERPESYLSRIAARGYDRQIIASIRKHHTSVLLQEVNTGAVVDALRGDTDTRILRDYRGVRVLSSFTPLQIPDLNWVLLAEIDEVEAFASVYRLREQLILSGLIILLFAIILGFIISGTMTRPIHALTRVSEQFGRGELHRRAAIRSQDEIGVLASAFNTMAEKITSHTQQLEDEIRERRLAEDRLQQSRQQFRNLSRHLQGAREEERKSIAREIHDDLGQRLTLHKLQLSLLQQDVNGTGTPAAKRLQSMTEEVDATIRSVRRLISQLRPGVLDDLGLTAAIEWQTDEFRRHTGIACSLRIIPPDITLDPECSTAIFRIFQETLTNVARHAHADRVTITLTADAKGTTLEITDNGCGISVAAIEQPSSFGLMGMRERASYFGGNIRFSGMPGKGTRVTVHFPQTVIDSLS